MSDNHTSPNHLANTDSLDTEFLKQATSHEGPWVSIFLPTRRAGREVMAARSQFQNLLKLAEQALTDAGHGDAVDELLADARDLTVENRDFWNNQADGLAVFIAPGLTRTFRLPMALPDEVAVGDGPRLHPLASLMSGTGSFYVLALSLNNVRLFEGTRDTIGQLALDGEKSLSLEGVFPEEDHQTHLQSSPQSGGGGQANFHGHGGDDNVATVDAERFFRHVATLVDQVVDRAVAHPIVLATVEGNQSLYRGVSKHRQLLDEFVSGSPDNLSPEQLHEQALPIARKVTRADDDALVERYGALLGTGKASDDQTMIAKAAAEGRVDTLLLRREATAPDGQAEVVNDSVDALILDTLRNSGSVTVIDEDEAPEVRAIFRY